MTRGGQTKYITVCGECGVLLGHEEKREFGHGTYCKWCAGDYEEPT